MKNKPEVYRHVVAKVAYQYAEANKTATHSVMKRKQLNRKQQQKSREHVKQKLIIFYRTLGY